MVSKVIFNKTIIDSLKDCYVVHPSEDYLIYSLGCTLIIKSLHDFSTTFLRGHEGRICTITASASGKFLASGEELAD